MGSAPFTDLNNSPISRIARNLSVVKRVFWGETFEKYEFLFEFKDNSVG